MSQYSTPNNSHIFLIFSFGVLFYLVLILFLHLMRIYVPSSSDSFYAHICTKTKPYTPHIKRDSMWIAIGFFKCAHKTKLPYIRPIYFVVAPLGFQFSISRRMTTNRYTTTTTACKKHQRNNPVHARKRSETKKTKAKLYGRMLNATSSTSAQINKMVMWRRAIRCICVIFFTQSKTKRKNWLQTPKLESPIFFFIFFFIESESESERCSFASIFWHNWGFFLHGYCLKHDRTRK